MTFTKDSGLVKIWIRAIIDGKKLLDDVPDIKNLREIIEQEIDNGS